MATDESLVTGEFDVAAYLNAEGSDPREYGSEAWKAVARERATCRQSIYYYTKAVACWDQNPNLFTAETFKESCDWIQWVLFEHKCGLFEDPRNTAKSTRTTLSIPQFVAIQRPDDRYDFPSEVKRAEKFLAVHTGIKGVDSRIVIASEKVDKAEKWVKLSRAQWTQNRYLRALFPELLWESHGYNPTGRLPEPCVWSASEYYLPGRTVILNDGYCRAIGITTGESGGRSDILLIDDLVSEQSKDSEADMAYRREWMQSIQQLQEKPGIADPAASTVFLITNRWNFNDPNSVIHDEKPDWSIWRRAIHKCGVHGLGNCGRLKSDVREIECSPTEKSIWPERHSDLDAIRRTVGPRTYATQWTNWPFEASDLDESLVMPFRFDRVDGEWRLLFGEGRNTAGGKTICDVPELPLSALTHCYLSVDPASADEESELRKRGKTARWAVSWYGTDEASGRIYCLDSRADHWSPDVALREIIDFWVHTSRVLGRPMPILYEKVAAQVLGKQALRLQAQSIGIAPPIVELMPVTRGPGKINDLRQKVGWVLNQRQLYVRDGLTVPRAEIRQFPTGFKDWLDTLRQYISKLLEVRNPGRLNDAAARKRRARRRARAQQAGPTGYWG